MINDFYRRFVKKDGSERYYVWASQVVTVLLMIISIVVTFFMNNIASAWKLLLVTGAGTGTVLLLRWFWWRINAWSEVSAMIAAALCSLSLQLFLKWDSDNPKQFAYIMLITVAFTTLVWLAATLLTQPEPKEKLIAFYQKVRPEGPGWNPIASEAGAKLPHKVEGLSKQLANWVLGCVLIYSFLFGSGYIFLGAVLKGLILVVVGIIVGAIIMRNLRSVAAPVAEEQSSKAGLGVQ